MNRKNFMTANARASALTASLGLTADQVEALKTLLDGLASQEDEADIAEGAPQIEIGLDGSLRRRRAGAPGAGLFSKRVPNHNDKRVPNNNDKRVPNNNDKRVPNNNDKRIPIGDLAEVAQVVRRLTGGSRVSLRDAYLVIPISLDDSDE